MGWLERRLERPSARACRRQRSRGISTGGAPSREATMIRQSLKRLLAPALSTRLLLPADRRVILIFHDVSNPGKAYFRQNYSTRTETFRLLVEFVADHFDLVSLRVITEPGERHGPRPLAAITFDDGFRSVRTEVLPLL